MLRGLAEKVAASLPQIKQAIIDSYADAKILI
jgi:hypothetical protein